MCKNAVQLGVEKAMKLYLQIIAILILATSHSALSAQDFAARHIEFFESRIRPLLINSCIECHGPQRQEGELRLDSRAAILTGGSRGSAVTDMRALSGPLLDAVGYKHDDLQMPPDGPLTDREVGDLRRWVKLGMPWPEDFHLPPNLDPSRHWAYLPIQSPNLPDVRKWTWPQTGIDRFILAKLEEAQLTPSDPASKQHLIRRLYLDVLGIPPSPEQVTRYLSDESQNATEQLVDRILTSPELGPKWARHWLDIARYADNKGYVFYLNREFSWSYTYRDYVIEAFNSDLNYDQFLLEQLAADQLDLGADKRPLRAMGLLTVGAYFTNNTHDIIDDRIDVVTRGLMGVTVTCARCHDHKYDPFTQNDYYALYGVIANSHDPIVPPLYESPPDTDAYREFKKQLDVKQTALESFITNTVANLREDGRTRITEYLIAAYNQRNNPDSSNFMLLTDKGAINPRMIRRWINYLKYEGDSGSPIWNIWNAYSQIPDDEFTEKSGEVFQQLTAEMPETNSIIAKACLEAAPETIDQLAKWYADALLQVKQSWMETTADPNNQATQLEDRAAEQLRLALYGEGSPPEIPTMMTWGFLDLFPDRTTQGEFKKLLGDVEGFIRSGAGAPPRALTLKENDVLAPSHVFVRGNPFNKGEHVPRSFPKVLSNDDGILHNGSGRLELANRIVAPSNPLTARVIVNRIWAHYFGRGLVHTTSDLGIRSGTPSHPQLLDYLATRLIQGGWSLKQLHREILLSAVYQQKSLDRTEATEKDPENQLLWKFNRKRLSWEATRDSLLAVTDEMSSQLGGPSFNLSAAWNPRRSVYAYINRLDVPTLLTTFDFPNPNVSIGDRSETTIAPQALYFLNNTFFAEITKRVLGRSDVRQTTDIQQRIELLYHILLGREPTVDDRADCSDFLGSNPDGVKWRMLIHVLVMSNEFLFVD
jgi:hypothetical protein